jgi:ABC-type uncharacterized transport system involved in gliding motility auxiliary subunit
MPPDFDHQEAFVTNPFMVPLSGNASNALGQHTVAAASPRIFVMADQYFAANLMMDYTGSSGNLDFLVNVVLWLTGEEDLLTVRNAGVSTKGLYKKSAEELSAAQFPALLFTGIVLPLILGGAWVLLVVYVRRRDKIAGAKP